MAALLGGVAACGAAPVVDVSAYPPEMKINYGIFDTRCSRCHDLERAINARVAEGGWEGYVRRMSLHPAAGLSEADQRAIVAFLEFHHARTDNKEALK
jgi:hypothetical protein